MTQIINNLNLNVTRSESNPNDHIYVYKNILIFTIGKRLASCNRSKTNPTNQKPGDKYAVTFHLGHKVGGAQPDSKRPNYRPINNLQHFLKPITSLPTLADLSSLDSADQDTSTSHLFPPTNPNLPRTISRIPG